MKSNVKPGNSKNTGKCELPVKTLHILEHTRLPRKAVLCREEFMVQVNPTRK